MGSVSGRSDRQLHANPFTRADQVVRPEDKFLDSHFGLLNPTTLESRSPNLDSLLSALDESPKTPSSEELVRRRSSDAWNRKWYRRMTRFGDSYLHVNGAQVITPFVALAVCFALLWGSREIAIQTLRSEHASDQSTIAALTERAEYERLSMVALQTKVVPAPPLSFLSRVRLNPVTAGPSAAREGRSYVVYDVNCPISRCTRTPVGVFSGARENARDIGVFVGLDGSQYVGEWFCGRSLGYGRWTRNGEEIEGYWQGDSEAPDENVDLIWITTRGQTQLPSSAEGLHAFQRPFASDELHGGPLC